MLNYTGLSGTIVPVSGIWMMREAFDSVMANIRAGEQVKDEVYWPLLTAIREIEGGYVIYVCKACKTSD